MMDRQFAFRKKIITKLLNLEEKASCPDAVVSEIIGWTNAQPLLTQKLCRLIDESETFIQSGEEAASIEKIVRSHLIDRWETQAASEHLQTLQENLLNNQQCDPLSLLQAYKKILQKGELLADGSPAQAELLNLGLVEQEEDKLKVANRIYQAIFDPIWVEQAISNKLQPTAPNSNSATVPLAAPGPSTSKETKETKPETLTNSPTNNSPRDPSGSLSQASLPKETPRNGTQASVARSNSNPVSPPSVAISPATRDAFSQSAPVSAASDTDNRSAEPKKSSGVLRYFWVLIGVAGLLVVGFSLFRWLQVETTFKQGNERLSQKDYRQAVEAYNKLLKIDSNYYQAWTNRGYGLAGLKEYNKMLESCTTATIIEPKSDYAWNCQGEALYNLKQYNEAIAAFDKAIALNSKDPVFWINRTESLIALKQTDPALESVNRAIALLEQTQATEGKEAVARELSIAYSHKGKTLSQKQDPTAALTAYEKSLTYDPNYFTALRGRGISLQELKRYDDAIGQFQQLLDRSDLNNDEKAEAGYYLGLTLCESNQPSKAIAAFDKALTLKPDYPAAEQSRKTCQK